MRLVAPGASVPARLNESQCSHFITLASVCFGLWEEKKKDEEKGEGEGREWLCRACDLTHELWWESCLFVAVVLVFILCMVPLVAHALPYPTTGAIFIDRRMRGVTFYLLLLLPTGIFSAFTIRV